MNFLDGYYNTGKKMRSKKARQEYYCAIIEYYYEGKEPEFKTEAADVGFEAISFSLRKARAGRLGGQANAEPNANQTPTKLEGNGNESRTKEEEEEVIAIPNGITNPPNPPCAIPFWQSCLVVLNETLGTTYTTMPTKCRHMLERSSETYTPEDVRKMIVYKRDEWREKDRKDKTTFSKNLTPNTLFSPDHFEQYMHQAKDAKEANDYAKYDL